METNSTFKSPYDAISNLSESSWPVWIPGWPAVILTIVAVSLSTRLLSGLLGQSKPAADGSKTVPLIPYWFPILGHLPNMGFDADGFLEKFRARHRGGVFQLNLGGTTHNMIFGPSLAGSLMNQKSSIADSEHLQKHFTVVIFGFPAKEMPAYNAANDELQSFYKYLTSEPSLGRMVSMTVNELKRNVGSLVGFVSSPVDQTLWERSSNVKVINTPGGQVVEASLNPLIRNFIAATANPSLTGTDFVNNFPEFWDDLWTFDKAFMLFVTGMPRWVPIPKLTRAHIARRRLINYMASMHVAAEKKHNGEDPGSEWSDLDNMSDLFKARAEAYRKYGYSIEARAASDVAIVWAMNANANPAVFWMLSHIYADKELLEALRTEIAPYVKVVQPKQEFPVPEHPRLESIDEEGLATKCPLLKSCYVETLRVDTAPWSFKTMRQDLVLSGRDKGAEKYLLKKGSFAHIPHALHQTDPLYFDSPEVWRPERHIKYEADEKSGDKKATVDLGTLRPYGGGATMCKGRQFAVKEILIFSAAIISLWDMDMAGGGPWKKPRHVKASGTYSTADDTRVWIKRRVLPQTKVS